MKATQVIVFKAFAARLAVRQKRTEKV
jgi:hypothetical protein